MTYGWTPTPKCFLNSRTNAIARSSAHPMHAADMHLSGKNGFPTDVNGLAPLRERSRLRMRRPCDVHTPLPWRRHGSDHPAPRGPFGVDRHRSPPAPAPRDLRSPPPDLEPEAPRSHRRARARASCPHLRSPRDLASRASEGTALRTVVGSSGSRCRWMHRDAGVDRLAVMSQVPPPEPTPRHPILGSTPPEVPP